MNLWLWIGLPLLFLLGIFINAIKDMQRLEKRLPKFLDQVRPPPDDEDDWAKRPPAHSADDSSKKAP